MVHSHPEKQQYANTLVVLACLTVVLLVHEKENVPARDLIAAQVLALAVAVKIVWVRIFNRKHEEASTAVELSEHAQQVGKTLMAHEVLWTLLAPWLWLYLDRRCNFELLRTLNQTVAYFVIPHLFFFQVQIVLESVLQVTGVVGKTSSDPWLLFDYTVLANCYRGVVLGEGLLRSLYALPTLQVYNVHHWIVVVILPVATTLLWLYSTLIFLPIHWYPTLIEGLSTTGVDEKSKTFHTSNKVE